MLLVDIYYIQLYFCTLWMNSISSADWSYLPQCIQHWRYLCSGYLAGVRQLCLLVRLWFRPEATLVKVVEVALTKVVDTGKVLAEVGLKLMPRHGHHLAGDVLVQHSHKVLHLVSVQLQLPQLSAIATTAASNTHRRCYTHTCNGHVPGETQVSQLSPPPSIILHQGRGGSP